jgi:hypothetical protein
VLLESQCDHPNQIDRRHAYGRKDSYGLCGRTAAASPRCRSSGAENIPSGRRMSGPVRDPRCGRSTVRRVATWTRTGAGQYGRISRMPAADG